MTNPYVGPRAVADGEVLYGREDDVSRLFYLLLADRLVLLYSPSGAGKTSLLEARLAPRLRQEGFTVFKNIRVGKAPEETVSPDVNRYALATMLSIECAVDEKDRLPITELTTTSLAAYLERLRKREEEKKQSVVLIFDQFEEVFTLDPADDAAKKKFFRDLGQALKDRSLWAVFAMREEFIARLDEYEPLIPSRLQARQRLALLSRAQAVEAMEKPAEGEKVEFSAAGKLAEDLSRIRVQRPDGAIEMVPGRDVEPVQLQVVCRTLWDKPRRRKSEISEKDLLGAVNVDNALADYYKVCVDDLVVRGFNERKVRDWFTRELIDDRSVRKQVMLVKNETAGLENAAIDCLVDIHHLVRREERGNRTFFELAHDRLVEPIRTNNVVWARRHLNEFQSRAQEWEGSDHNPAFLARDVDLVRAIRWAEQNKSELTESEKRFLEESNARLNDFEKAAIKWELSDRDATLLLTGDALEFARMNAKQKGPLGTTTAEKALLASSNVHRRAEVRERYYRTGLILMPFVMIPFFYVQNLKNERNDLRIALEKRAVEDQARKVLGTSNAVAGTWSDVPAPKLEVGTVAQIFDAQLRISQLTTTDAEAPHRVSTIRYFVKPTENPKLLDALTKELGFTVTKVHSALPQQTNIITYSKDVPPEELKLIAYAIIRAGNDLQTIRPFTRKDLGDSSVGIFFNAKYADETPLTTADIDKLDLNAVNRKPADFISENSGTIESYDAATGEGVIDSSEGKFPFHAIGSNVAPKDEVKFEVYESTRRKYASGLQRIRKADGTGY